MSTIFKFSFDLSNMLLSII